MLHFGALLTSALTRVPASCRAKLFALAASIGGCSMILPRACADLLALTDEHIYTCTASKKSLLDAISDRALRAAVLFQAIELELLFVREDVLHMTV